MSVLFFYTYPFKINVLLSPNPIKISVLFDHNPFKISVLSDLYPFKIGVLLDTYTHKVSVLFDSYLLKISVLFYHYPFKIKVLFDLQLPNNHLKLNFWLLISQTWQLSTDPWCKRKTDIQHILNIHLYITTVI